VHLNLQSLLYYGQMMTEKLAKQIFFFSFYKYH